MTYQFTTAFVILSLAFTVTVVGNFLLAITILKLKRDKEREAADRRRHVDVLFTARAVGDVLGACLNYPLLFHLYQLASKEKKVTGYYCEILGSSGVFYFSYIAILTVTTNLHHIISGIWPFHFFIYLRKKNSKIPFVCIAVSLLVALVSLSLSASGYPLFDLTHDKYFNIVTCVVINVSHNRAYKYYYIMVGHLWFWTHFLVFIVTTWQYIKMKNNIQVCRITGKKDWVGLPQGSSFQMAYKLLYVIVWTPFFVSLIIIIIMGSTYIVHFTMSQYLTTLSDLVPKFHACMSTGTIRSLVQTQWFQRMNTCFVRPQLIVFPWGFNSPVIIGQKLLTHEIMVRQVPVPKFGARVLPFEVVPISGTVPKFHISAHDRASNYQCLNVFIIMHT
jgi:hypothetical protein